MKRKHSFLYCIQYAEYRNTRDILIGEMLRKGQEAKIDFRIFFS